jgi:hypothetical protein
MLRLGLRVPPTTTDTTVIIVTMTTITIIIMTDPFRRWLLLFPYVPEKGHSATALEEFYDVYICAFECWWTWQEVLVEERHEQSPLSYVACWTQISGGKRGRHSLRWFIIFQPDIEGRRANTVLTFITFDTAKIRRRFGTN